MVLTVNQTVGCLRFPPIFPFYLRSVNKYDVITFYIRVKKYQMHPIQHLLHALRAVLGSAARPRTFEGLARPGTDVPPLLARVKQADARAYLRRAGASPHHPEWGGAGAWR